MFFKQARMPVNARLADGIADDRAIYDAAYDSLQYVENSNAAAIALEEAYRRRIKSVEDATGVRLANPVFADYSDYKPMTISEEMAYIPKKVDEQRANFSARLIELAAQFPEQAKAIGADQPVDDDALAIARAADERFGQVMQSRDDLWKYASSLAGGGVASLKDPITIGSLAVGGGAGGARTIGGRILVTAFSEMLVNGASEAAMQPAVQAWRKKAGLPSGFDEGLKNVAFAASIGGILGGGGRAVGEAVGALAGRVPASTERALAGDGAAAADALESLRPALPDEARGALDALRQDKLVTDAKPATLDDEFHQAVLAEAEMAVRDGRRPIFKPDENQISRLIDKIAPPLAADFNPLVHGADIDVVLSEARGRVARPKTIPKRPVAAFLRGKIDPETPLAGDLRAAGIDAKTFPDLFSEAGGSVDNIPVEDAIEAVPGLANRPDIDDGAGYVDPRIWHDALIDELNGEPWLSEKQAAALADIQQRADLRKYLEENGVDFKAPAATQRQQMQAIAEAESKILEGDARFSIPERPDISDFTPPAVAARLYANDVVRELAEMAGPGVDDDILAAAALDVAFNRTGKREALDAAMGLEAREVPYVDEPDYPDTFPEARGVDDPAAPDELFTDLTDADFEGLPNDAELPFDDGLLSLTGVKDEIARIEWLGRVVEACRV